MPPTSARDTPSPLVALDGAGKTFANGTVALEALDLAIGRGEFVALLGPSGCGKSTVLRLLAGLTAPTTGKVLRPGLPDAARGQVGFVFQDATLLPWATAFDNVFLPLRLGGVRREVAATRVTEALESVGLADMARAHPHQLSGGMRMRVSIARALVTAPALLLMDEPFAALDEMTRQKLNDDVLALWQRTGTTTVFVTHSVYEAAYLATRAIVLSPRPGRVVGDFPIDQPARRNEDYRLSPAYQDTCRTLSRALRGCEGP